MHDLTCSIASNVNNDHLLKVLSARFLHCQITVFFVISKYLGKFLGPCFSYYWPLIGQVFIFFPETVVRIVFAKWWFAIPNISSAFSSWNSAMRKPPLHFLFILLIIGLCILILFFRLHYLFCSKECLRLAHTNPFHVFLMSLSF